MFQEKTAQSPSSAPTVLLDNPFQLLSCHRPRRLFEQQWKADSRFLNTGSFREQMWAAMACLRRSRPSRLLLDGLNFGFVLVPEDQDWINQFVAPIVLASVERLALVPSDDVFTRVAVLQLFEDNLELRAVARDFESREDALRWLCG